MKKFGVMKKLWLYNTVNKLENTVNKLEVTELFTLK